MGMAEKQPRRPTRRVYRPRPTPRRRRAYYFIINNAAGTGHDETAPKLAKKLEKRLHRNGWDCFTKNSSDSESFDQAVADSLQEHPYAIIVFGGDGSFRRAAAQAAKANVLIGLVPTGRHNNISLSLYGTVDQETALDTIATGHETRIDAGVANGRFFVGSLVTGLLPAMIARIGGDKLPRLAMSWGTLAGKAADDTVPLTTTIKIDAHTFQAQPRILNVHLLPHMLTLRMAPAVTPDDGRLLLIYDKDASRDTIADYVRDLKKGRYQYSDPVQLIRGRGVTISPAAGRKWLMDGDEVEFSGEDLSVEVVPSALRIFTHVPPK